MTNTSNHIIITPYRMTKIQKKFFELYKDSFDTKNGRFIPEKFREVEKISLTFNKNQYRQCVPFVMKITSLYKPTSILQITGELGSEKVFLELMTDVHYSSLLKSNRGIDTHSR